MNAKTSRKETASRPRAAEVRRRSHARSFAAGGVSRTAAAQSQASSPAGLERAAQLGHHLAEIAVGPSIGARTQVEAHAPIQAFGVEDRDWSKVGEVASLKSSGGVYLLKAGDQAVVVKRGGDASDAVKEAMAAELGTLAELGVDTVKTVPLLVASAEVQKGLLPKLRKLDRKAHDTLAAEKSVIVMPYIEGTDLRHAKDVVQGADPSQRYSWYRAMGRLWAFDVFIANSDRFLTGTNMGNIMISADGVLYGIDQALGFSAVNEAGNLGEAKAASRLEDLMDGNARLGYCRQIYDNIDNDLEGYSLDDEEAFCHYFEQGILAALPKVRSIDMMKVLSIRRQLPKEVQGIARDIGLGGMPGIRKAFADTEGQVRSRPIPIPKAKPRTRVESDEDEELSPRSVGDSDELQFDLEL